MNFNDKLVRYSLVYCINNSRHKDNTALKHYVLKEMTNNDLLSVVWFDKNILETNEKIKVPSWATTPFYIIAGGSLSSSIYKGLQKIARGRFQSKIPRTAETLAGASIAFGATVLANSVFHLYKRVTDDCTKHCKGMVKKGKNYQAQFSVCFHHCKVNSLTKLIQKLRVNKAMCGKTRYPEKCVDNLNQQIVKYQGELEKELYRLRVSKSTLYRRQTKVPAIMSAKPTIEKR